MAASHRAIVLARQNRRRLPRPRVFLDRTNPLEILTEDEVCARYRFRPNTIVYLVGLCMEVERGTARSYAIQPLLAVLTYLRYLATGSFQLTVADTVRLSQATVSRVCHQVGRALARLGDRFILFPDGDYARQVKQQFGLLAGFPNVIGVVDCTHVWIQKPTVHPEDVIGRKGVPTINVQAVCDHMFRITSVVVMWPGRTHDARIWRQSALRHRFEQGEHLGFLLADSGYECSRYMLTHYVNPAEPAQTRYNGALCRTRVTIEQAFGILKQRFQILRRKVNTTPEVACMHTKNCFILHNIGIHRQDIMNAPPAENFDGQFHNVGGQDNVDGRATREYITRAYFNN